MRVRGDCIDLTKKLVPLVPAELIFNMDEISLSDWEDSTSKPVLVPTDLGDSMIHYPVNRQIRPPVLYLCFRTCILLFARVCQAVSIPGT
jgi:hypothetical protein